MSEVNGMSAELRGSHAARETFRIQVQSDLFDSLKSIHEANKLLDAAILPAYDAAMRLPSLTDAERQEVAGIVSDFQEIAGFNEERCHPHYAEKARRRAAMLIGILERLG